MRTPSLLLLLALLAGCQVGGDGSTASASAAAENPLAAPSAAPYVEIETADALIDAIRETGAEIVVVNFWATWCGPCRIEFPDLLRYDEAMEDQGVEVRFVSVDFPSDGQFVQDFLNEQGVEETSFLFSGYGDVIGMLNPDLGGNVPVTMVFDGNGTLLRSHLGVLTFDTVGELVAAAQTT